ncbi:MAG: DUF6406 domain-containing protein [Actinocatenispora sp.]
MTGQVGMKHGIPSVVGSGRAGVGYVRSPGSGAPTEVELTVLEEDGTERDLTLHPGDRFTVGDTEWVLQGVDDPGDADYTVWVAPA